MACIPMVRWTRKDESYAFFPSFVLVDPEKLSCKLTKELERLVVRENGEKELILKTDDSLPKEGYRMEITPTGVAIIGKTPQGLHYGLSTLKLLLFSYEDKLPMGVIEDTPNFRYRGIMLDVSRGKMASMDYLKQLIPWMSDLKYNVLQLYCEDKLALSAHPMVGSLTGAYTKEQIQELDALCQAHYIELQPCIQTYSHMHGILRLPGYEKMAENEVLFSLAAGNDGVYRFLEEEFSEVLPWFSAKTLNINMDEAYDLGTGYSAAAVEAEGKGPVFITYIQKVIEIARRCGAQTIQMWGDAPTKYPELMAQLPEDVVFIDWNYNPQEDYPSIDGYPALGRPFWAAGGVSTWNSLFPRTYNAYVNLIGYSAKALSRGAEGFLVTDWGDYGHMQPLGLSLYGYLLGAQQAYWGSRIRPEAFEDACWPLVFRDEKVRQAFRLLMDSNMAPNIKTGFKTMSIYYFFDDMLDGLAMKGNERYPRVEEAACRILAENGRQAYERLMDAEPGRYPDENWQALFGEAYLEELKLSAWMTWFAGEKGLLAYEIKKKLADPKTVSADIMELIGKIHKLYQQFQKIRQAFGRVWCLRAQWTGIECSMSLFDRAGAQMVKTVSWLEAQRERLVHGEAMDVPYTAAKDYGVLWTSDFKNMWDRAYPWQ